MDTFVLFNLLAIGALLIFSGFFSGSETGLTAVSKATMHRLQSQGSKSAKIVNDLRADKDRMIGAILLGNNAINILASALATNLAVQYIGEGGVIFATIAMTLLVLIFAEVLPKTYALYNAEKVALFVAPILSIVVIVLAPITKGVQWGVNGILDLFGGRDTSDYVSAADELRGAIEMHHKEGNVVKHDRDMLGGVLDLSSIEVMDVMIHRKHITSIDSDLPTTEIIEKILASSHSRIPLWKDSAENIVGVIHIRSLLSALQAANGRANDVDLPSLIKEPWYVPETTPLSKQLAQFRKLKNHLAFVVDEYGDLVGLITLEDILEEIVGHIHDEYDSGFQGIQKLSDQRFTIDGVVSIRDVNRMLEWDLPEDDATTIAGLVINLAESIPETGETYQMDGYRFTVVGKKDNQITSIEVKKN